MVLGYPLSLAVLWLAGFMANLPTMALTPFPCAQVSTSFADVLVTHRQHFRRSHVLHPCHALHSAMHYTVQRVVHGMGARRAIVENAVGVLPDSAAGDEID
jgi:purine nucleoside phosphorylase